MRTPPELCTALQVHVADGAVYVDTIHRVARGEVRRAIPLGSAHVNRRGRVTLELHRVVIGDEVLELDAPLAVTVALSGDACSALAGPKGAS